MRDRVETGEGLSQTERKGVRDVCVCVCSTDREKVRKTKKD